MKKTTITFLNFFFVFLLVVAVTATPAFSQTVNLAELKKNEDERRKKAEKSKYSVSDENLNSIEIQKKPHSLIHLQGEGESREETMITAAPVAPPSDENNTEEFWRSQKKEIDERIAAFKSSAKELQSQLNQLWTDFYQAENEDQQKDLQARIDQMGQQLEDTRLTVAHSEKELADFMERARKAGVPPGWLR